MNFLGWLEGKPEILAKIIGSLTYAMTVKVDEAMQKQDAKYAETVAALRRDKNVAVDLTQGSSHPPSPAELLRMRAGAELDKLQAERFKAGARPVWALIQNEKEVPGFVPEIVALSRVEFTNEKIDPNGKHFLSCTFRECEFETITNADTVFDRCTFFMKPGQTAIGDGPDCLIRSKTSAKVLGCQFRVENQTIIEMVWEEWPGAPTIPIKFADIGAPCSDITLADPCIAPKNVRIFIEFGLPPAKELKWDVLPLSPRMAILGHLHELEKTNPDWIETEFDILDEHFWSNGSQPNVHIKLKRERDNEPQPHVVPV